jgi:hypothetical protein
MRRLLLIIGLIMLASQSFASEQTNLFGGNVTFDLPDDFSVMSEEIAKIKYPMESHRPKYIYSNDRTTTSIAINFTENSQLQPNQFQEFKAYMEETLTRMIPGIKWIKRDYVEINGKKWIYLELMSAAIDTDIHNVMLMTSFNNKPLMFNFNSTKEEFPKVIKNLQISINSIRVKEISSNKADAGDAK